MLVVNVSVDSEQSFQNQFGDGDKVSRKGNSNLAGKESLVVYLVLYPSHQVVNVLGSRALDGLLHVLAVRPVVLVLGAGRHHRAGVLSAVVAQRPHQHRQLVEEVDRVDRHPLVHVFPIRQHDGLPQVAGAQSSLGVPSKDRS